MPQKVEASMNFESRNPATGELLGVYPEHDKKETNARLQRAWDGPEYLAWIDQQITRLEAK